MWTSWPYPIAHNTTYVQPEFKPQRILSFPALNVIWVTWLLVWAKGMIENLRSNQNQAHGTKKEICYRLGILIFLNRNVFYISEIK